MANRIVTAEQLREKFAYDRETGAFYQNRDFGSRYKQGDRADHPAHSRLAGYRFVSIINQKVLAHRAAWLYVYGEFPSMHIDHINGDRSDNRISNLRIVSHKQNIENQRKPSKRSTTGFLGVHKHQGKFRASITVNRKRVHIGMFDTPESAHAAYVEAKRKYHQGCTL